MRSFSGFTPSVLVSAGVAVLLSGGGIVALAAIPGNDGVIHGCYGNGGGQLRVVDPSARAGGRHQHCGAKETSVAFAQRGRRGFRGSRGLTGATGQPGALGPQGDAGPTGPQGLAGGSGPPVAPTIYSAANSGKTLSHTQSAPTIVVSLNLPAGSYSIEGSLQVSRMDDNNTPVESACSLTAAGVAQENQQYSHPVSKEATVSTIANYNATQLASIPFQGVLTNFAGGMVDVRCSQQSLPADVEVSNPRLSALSVGAVSSQ